MGINCQPLQRNTRTSVFNQHFLGRVLTPRPLRRMQKAGNAGTRYALDKINILLSTSGKSLTALTSSRLILPLQRPRRVYVCVFACVCLSLSFSLNISLQKRLNHL
jgi:hypothetical protein